MSHTICCQFKGGYTLVHAERWGLGRRAEVLLTEEVMPVVGHTDDLDQR